MTITIDMYDIIMAFFLAISYIVGMLYIALKIGHRMGSYTEPAGLFGVKEKEQKEISEKPDIYDDSRLDYE